MIEARFWQPEGEGRVRCGLCPHHCLIAEGKTGICGVRQNGGGKLFSLVWGSVVAAHVDPVEKKPLFHFHPGSDIFSLATAGCNLSCRHCQNADISQMPRDGRDIVGRESSPEEIASRAGASGCLAIAYTYTEPTIFFEFAYDISAEARKKGLKNVFVTNGFIEAEPLRAIAPLLDAANVDLKGFTEDFYHRICGARLKPVLEAITLYRELGIWLEITTLFIPGLNDAEEEMRGIARFIRGLGPEIPWHVSRFHPDYRMTDRPGTPESTLDRAWKIGREEGLLYVYQGNVPGRGEDTFCPKCGRAVIKRWGFTLREYRLKSGVCDFCGFTLHGVGL